MTVIRRITIVRTNGSASGFCILSEFDSARSRQAKRHAAASRSPNVVSPDIRPRISIVQYQPWMIPLLNAYRTNTRIAPSSISRWSIAGPNTCPTSHTGSEHTHSTTPCTSTTRTIQRHQALRCVRLRMAVGSVSLKIAINNIATSPKDTNPPKRRMRIACAMSKKRKSGCTIACQRSGNAASGGWRPAATATSSHAPGGSQAYRQNHESAATATPKDIAVAHRASVRLVKWLIEILHFHSPARGGLGRFPRAFLYALRHLPLSACPGEDATPQPKAVIC